MKKKCIILVTSITLYKKIGIGKATAVTNKARFENDPKLSFQ